MSNVTLTREQWDMIWDKFAQIRNFTDDTYYITDAMELLWMRDVAKAITDSGQSIQDTLQCVQAILLAADDATPSTSAAE